MVARRSILVKIGIPQTTDPKGTCRAIVAPVNSPSLDGLVFSLVGPGRVGESLSAWLEAHGGRRVAVAGKSAGEGRIALQELTTAGQDLLLLAVSDMALPGVAAALARRPQAAVVLHTSGSLDASVLDPLRHIGSAVGSLHPLKAFPRPLTDPVQGRGVFFAVDGDPAARELAFRLVSTWEGVAAEVPAPARPLYHLAASLSAGGVVTLLAMAEEIAERLGLPREVTRGYLELCRGALAAAIEAHTAGEPLGAALTGPAARGDRATLKRHLEALAAAVPQKLTLLRHLARETVHQRGRAAVSGEDHRKLLEELERT